MADPEHYGKYIAPAAVAAVVLGIGLPLPLLAVLGVAALLFCSYSAVDGLLLVGPFPRTELVRNVRRYRVHLWRTVVTLAAAVPTLVLLRVTQDLRGGDRTQAAEGVLVFVFWHLFLVIMGVTVTFLTTAIVEEREAKRLDFLLVTDLRNREIVLGKTLARGAAGMAYLLGTLPILLLYPFWFGVDPGVPLLLVGYAAVSLFSIGSAAVLGSTLAKTRRLGGQLHARLIVPYVVLTFLMDRLKQFPEIWFFPGTPSHPTRFAVSDLVDLFGLGNPATLFMQVVSSIGRGLDIRPVVAAFPGYAAFHIGSGLLFLLLAIRQLRRVSADLAGEPPPPPAFAATKPPVWRWPVVWKEVYSRPQEWGRKGNRVVVLLALVLLVAAPTVAVLGSAVSDLGGYAEPVRRFARIGLPLIACIGVLAAMTVGGSTVAKERDRDTLTTLVVTSLTPRDILLQKWIGVIGQTRPMFYWAGILGAACVVAGVFPWYSLVAFAASMTVSVAFAVAVGLWVSAKAASVEKAGRVLAFFLGFGLSGGIGFTGFAAAVVASGPVPFGPLAVALVPPTGLAAATHAEMSDPGHVAYWAAGLAAGWVLYSLLAYFVFTRAVRRFEAAIQSG